MIVADTNLVSYLLLPGDRTPIAEQVLKKDPHWIAPLLWRSEFRNVLAQYGRRGEIPLQEALRLMQLAEELFFKKELLVPSDVVLSLAEASGCSAYDCEFVAVARQWKVPLVTSDKQILKAFPGLAVEPERFVA